MATQIGILDYPLATWTKGKILRTWDMADVINLEWQTVHHRDDALNQELADLGHHYDSMVIDICQQDQMLPAWCQTIADSMNLSNAAVALHRMRPGKYLPLHSDLYGAYKRINQITTQSITRIIVFLEYHKPGHMLDIDGDVLCNWSAGDWVSWTDDTIHAAYNMGTEDRYTLQITGHTGS